jgi:hypothetical protein
LSVSVAWRRVLYQKCIMADDIVLQLSSKSNSNPSDPSLPAKLAKLEARMAGKSSSSSSSPSVQTGWPSQSVAALPPPPPPPPPPLISFMEQEELPESSSDDDDVSPSYIYPIYFCLSHCNFVNAFRPCFLTIL